MAGLFVAGLFVLVSLPSVLVAFGQRHRYPSWAAWLHGSAQSETERGSR